MTLKRSVWLVALAVLLLFARFNLAAWLNERPVLEVRDGQLFITSAKDRNITLQTLGSSSVNINGINVVDVATRARDASELVERWKMEILDMGNKLRQLTEFIEGPSGVQSRLRAIELGTEPNRTNGIPNSSGNESGGFPSRIDAVARARIQRLTTRVREAENQIASLRRKLETDECASNPCQNGGTCEDIIDGYKCRCRDGWEGPQCTADIDECERYVGTDLGCQNGATCRNLIGTYRCDCPVGWYGIHCTKKTNDCINANAQELCGHGVCVNKAGPGAGYTCICDQGWQSDGTNPACTKDVDECASQHRPACSVNPMVPCINVPGTFYCGGCPQGYTGNGYYCNDINECDVNNGGCSTTPSVQCINTMGSRICGACPPGFQGDGITCSYVGACTINNGGCHPLATCMNNPGMSNWNVQCRCPLGYQGSGMGPNGCTRTTEISSSSGCSSRPCIHGICIPNGQIDYICRCESGYIGTNCESPVNPCEPNPCRNSGTCSISARRTAVCRCTADFAGPRCTTARQSCGGISTDPAGTLQFPGGGNTYQHGLSCAWVLNTNSSSVLNVTFSAFNLEQSTDCKFDFLQIHDGHTAGEHMIGKYCGNSLPAGGNIISTHHSLYLWFHSDNTVSHDGFTLQWNSIDPLCGGEIFAEYGTISSPGSPGRYPLNRDCYWYVAVTSGKRILFQFSPISLEEHPTCQKDYLEIKDGPDEGSHQLGIYCNHTRPPPLYTTASEAWLHFHSDSTVQDTGFHVTFSSIEGSPGCGGYYTAPSGQITSPNFGSNYDTNLDCEWKIQVPIGERIKITWITFELEQSRRCKFDFVEVYDGVNREAPLLGRYCGMTLPASRISTSNILQIRFKSDWSYSKKGFKMSYEVWCGGEFTEESGTLKSPYYPNAYPALRACIYEIIQPPNKAIKLTILDMDIEGSNFPNCYFDFLQIRDGDNENSTVIGNFCGDNSSIPELPIMSTHNHLWLKFNTDSTVHKRGFMATYETVERRCGGLFRAPSGIIQTPSDEGRYGNSEACTWIIQAPPGFVVQLNWLSFELEYEYSCRHDYIKIFDNITSSVSQQDMGTYCGSTKPPMLTTQSRMMTIMFHSDSSLTKDGFVASYIFIDASRVCGGHFHALTGVITSPNYPNHYPENRECEWVISAPNRHQVALNVKKFDIESHSGCAFDYLEIRNGGSATSPLMGKYCGTDIPSQIMSFGNQLYLKFKTDVSRGGEGFQIEWDSTAIGCGGTLSTASGSIFSPNYPQPYGRLAECTWQITVSAGSVIQFVIVDLELETDARCRLDYIEIYEGLVTHGKKLGRYCASNHPLQVQTTSNMATIRFRSDYSFSGRGFQMNYHALCSIKLRGYRGVIESPNFPNNYPDRENCSWVIEAPMGNKLNLTFSHFDLEPGSENFCSNDYLEIKEGENDQPNRNFGKFCGSELPPKIVSTQNQVFLNFFSDTYLAYHGFRLEWLVNGCGGHLIKPQGTITSPGYPHGYPRNINCEWYIEVDQLNSIEITLEDIDLEKLPACSYDKFIMYSGADENAPQLIETCHVKDRRIFTSTGNKLFVKFYSDYSHQSSGFKVSYKSVGLQCGGRFTTPAGVIHSTNYPNSNYPPTQNCEWFIQVPINHLINLTFSEFDIESSRNCTFDYVRIHDGPTTDSPVLGTHCRSVLPPSYTSSSNELLVVMRTDSSLSAKGFMATYKLACGARIVANEPGIISMDPSVGLHTDMVNCTWTIVAPNSADHVTLTLTEMQVQSTHYWHDGCESSSIQVFEGEGVEGPSLGIWCGTKVPPPITSQGNALTIHAMDLYGALYDAKFTGTYSVLNSACGGNYTSEHGAIATPGYPNSYPNNIECVWYLYTSPGNRLSLSFREFDLIESEHCNSDYVEVREESGIGKLIGVYCGKNIDAINSGKTLWVKFKSSEEGSKKGFVADYSMLHGGDLSGPSGDIASPAYPKPMLLQGEYSWRITVDPLSSIQITFKEFHIEQYEDSCYVYLAIYDGYDENAPELMNKCGAILPEAVRSSSNMVYITLSTSALRKGSWFLLSWLQIPREFRGLDGSLPEGNNCDQIISLDGSNITTYTLTSPGWPNGYANNLDCSWTFSSLPGTHLVLRFNRMDLEETEGCIADQVKVFSGHSLDNPQEEWSEIGNFCLTNASSNSIETSDLMKVSFHSDVYANKTGFRATVRSVCGGRLYGPNGVIEMNKTSPINSFWSLPCEWNIAVRPGRTIEVQLISLDIKRLADTTCSSNYLMLKNGGSTSSPILGDGKYCGNVIPAVLQTSGNQLYVKVSGSKSDIQFKLTYREVGMNCGGEIVLSQSMKTWNISTPNYPNIPSPHSECFWRIMAPAGEPIMIHFLERFDLKQTDNCDREYLEIRDGGTDSAALIGQICGNELPSSQKTTGNFMYLHFYTDVDDPQNGFKASVSIGDRCGGLIRGTHGVLQSPNYPMTYPNNITCTWRIVGLERHTVKLQFQDLDLPRRRNCGDVDHIDISEEIKYNETGEPARREIGQYCGNTKSEAIESSGNVVQVTFTTDNMAIGGYKGFSMNFTTSFETCGGSLEGTQGEFSSPGYPNVRTHPRYCQWKITVPEGFRVKIDILDYDIGGDISTRRPLFGTPQITFYNDFNFDSRIIRLQPSDTNRQILGTSNTMLIWYFSNAGANRGFKARYSGIVPGLCGGLMTYDHGTLITTDNSVFNLTSFYCRWKVNSPWMDENSQTLALSVIGNIGNIQWTSLTGSSCRYRPSNVVVTGGADKIAYICGDVTQGITVRSPSPANVITAVSGVNRWWGLSTTINFTMNYRWHKCGGVLGGSFHTITAPKNLTYPVDCSWHVKFPDDGEGIMLTIKKLNLVDCERNYILVRNGDPLGPNAQKYCGSILSNMTSRSNQLWIEYHAEASSNEFELQLDTIQGGCGGSMQGGSGVITSPGFPSQYPKNAECSWLITVETGFHIGLVFVDRFHLETSDNCINDFIQTYDWRLNPITGTSDWVEQPKLCGRNSPQPVNSTSNKMKIIFRSNNNHEADGFRARWNVNCGGIFEVSKNTNYVTSPRWPGRYDDNLFCNYTFIAPEKIFVVKFTEFQLEGGGGNCQFDNVSIINPNHLYDRSVWCDGNRPPVQRVQSRLELHFKTDSFISRRGFRLIYYLDDCGGIINKPSDLSSPSIDDSASYYERINCSWTVQAPAGKAIVLRFESFILEFSPQCTFDYVNVFSGLTTQKESRLASLCGNLTGTLPVIPSTNGSMTINFVTDGSFNYGGFKAKILFTSGVAAGCGGEIQLSQEPQEFRTQVGTTYESLEDCHWLIRAPSANTIVLTITSLDLKNTTIPIGSNASRPCPGDYLEIRDGLGPFAELIGQYCGNIAPPPITSSSNAMWIRFVTDDILNGNGVQATLKSLPSPCGNATFLVGNETQVLTSPAFPSMYQAGLRCRWTLMYTNPEWRWTSLTIHFKQFDLGNAENCNEDKLTISNKNDQSFVSEGFGEDLIFSGTSTRPRYAWRRSRMPHETFTYCGNALPPDFHSSGGTVLVTFQSSQSPKAFNHTGFKFEYSSNGCNRNFSGTQGRIVHRDITNCRFTITAPVGHTISLYFNDFSVYSRHGCTDSGLQVHDGNFSSGTLAELCGIRLPNPIFSSGNQLSLYSWAEDRLPYQTYDITYTTTDKACFASSVQNERDSVGTRAGFFSQSMIRRISVYQILLINHWLQKPLPFWTLEVKQARGCGGKIYNYGGRFSSPLYPGPYRNVSECIWEVSVPMGFRVRFQFDTFDLGVRETCDTDYLQVYDVPVEGEAILSSTYCGGDNPAPYQSNEGKVLVKYKTSMNNGGTGWLIDFTAERHGSESTLYYSPRLIID